MINFTRVICSFILKSNQRGNSSLAHVQFASCAWNSYVACPYLPNIIISLSSLLIIYGTVKALIFQLVCHIGINFVDRIVTTLHNNRVTRRASFCMIWSHSVVNPVLMFAYIFVGYAQRWRSSTRPSGTFSASAIASMPPATGPTAQRYRGIGKPQAKTAWCTTQARERSWG